MEWVSADLATVFGVILVVSGTLLIIAKTFRDMVSNMGDRTDPALIKLFSSQQEYQAKQDAAQAKREEAQTESLASLAASQEAQVKTMEAIAQMQQAAVNGLTTIIEQLKPVSPMADTIQTIQAQSSELSDNMQEHNQTMEGKLNEIIKRLDGLQKTLDDMSPRLKDAETAVSEIRGQVVEIKTTRATQEQEIAAVSLEVAEPKPETKTEDKTNV